MVLNYVHMKSLLDEAMQQAKALPEERQNDLGEILLNLIEQDASDYQLNDEQVREVRRRMASGDTMVPFEADFRSFNSQA